MLKYLPVYEESTQFFLVQISFWYYFQHPNCILISFPSYKSKLIFSKYIIQITFKISSKNSRYSLRCMGNEADCGMVPAFCSFRLLLKVNHNFNEIFGPLSRFIFVVDQLCLYFSQNLFPTIWVHSQVHNHLLLAFLSLIFSIAFST